MKRNWKIAVIAVCAVMVLAAGFAAAAGSPDDPLITLGYLKNIFTPQIETYVDEAVALGTAQNQVDFDAALQEWDTRVNEAIEAVENTPVTVNPASFVTVPMAEVNNTKKTKDSCESKAWINDALQKREFHRICH